MKNNKRSRSRIVERYLHFDLYVVIGDIVKKIKRWLQRKHGRFLHAFLGAAVVSIIFTGLFFLVFPIKYCPSNDRYILSTISQSLAALSALIFAFTLIVLELGHKHKGLIDEFFRIWPNWIYPIIYAFGIILPLLLLKRGIFDFTTYMAICYAIFCVLMIIPYFMRVKLFIKYNIGIRYDAEQARRVISQSDKCEYAQILKFLYELCQESANNGNPGTIVVGYREISKLVYYVYNKISANNDSVESTIKCLTDLILAAHRQDCIKDISEEIFTTLPSRLQLLDLRNINIYFSVTETLFKVGNKTSNKKVKMNLYSSIWLMSAIRVRWRKKELRKIKNNLRAELEKIDKTNRKIFLQCGNPNVYAKYKVYGENVYSAVELENAEKSIILELQNFLLCINLNKG